MTDNEIIKALECCIDCKCKECPCYRNIDGEMRCTEIDEEEILDLINRLKAENEKLNIELKAMRGAVNSYKADVERLQKAIKVQDIMIEQQDYKIEAIKSEAIKEFAERLKARAAEMLLMGERFSTVDTDDIDNLVTELTESE